MVVANSPCQIDHRLRRGLNRCSTVGARKESDGFSAVGSLLRSRSRSSFPKKTLPRPAWNRTPFDGSMRLLDEPKQAMLITSRRLVACSSRLLRERTSMNLVVSYEARLDADPRWAMSQGSRHFERESDVWRSLRRVACCLDDRGIRYAVIGALAMFYHGHRRFTIDVDLIVTAADLAAIHAGLDDLGCVRPDPARRSVLDRDTGVRFDFTSPGPGRATAYRSRSLFPIPRTLPERQTGLSTLTCRRWWNWNSLRG